MARRLKYELSWVKILETSKSFRWMSLNRLTIETNLMAFNEKEDDGFTTSMWMRRNIDL